MDTDNLTASDIAKRIISGERLTSSDNTNFLLTTPLEKLQEGAALIQKNFHGNHIDLCTIVNGKSGHCPEDCKYCAQSARYKTGIDEHDFLTVNEILAAGLANEKAGVNRFSVVTVGRALGGESFEKAVESYKVLRSKLKIGLCASHGILSAEQLRRLKDIGVTNYHHNIETSRRYFPYICTSHTFDDRIKTIKAAQSVGLNVCSGGIIGMGETWHDRIDMAFELAALKINSIPVNILNPIKGTPLGSFPLLEPTEILRTVTIFRYINPTANIRLAAGRKFLPDKGASALTHGASAIITGNMLTTSGNTINDDLKLLRQLGLTNAEP